MTKGKPDITWITGASSGIGKAIALEFIKNNKKISISARSQTILERIKNEFSGSAIVHVNKLDVKDFTLVEKAAKSISNKFNINCLINNAGVTTFERASDNSFEEITEIIDTNLLGSIFTTRSVLPYMIEAGKGTIINIISVAALKVFEKSSVYSASKAGLLAYTNVLREEVREHNIKIVNVLPGATKTPIWPNEALEKFSDRMMSPEDIAKLIYYVSSLNLNLVPEEITIRPIKGDL